MMEISVLAFVLISIGLYVLGFITAYFVGKKIVKGLQETISNTAKEYSALKSEYDKISEQMKSTSKTKSKKLRSYTKVDKQAKLEEIKLD